MMRDRDLAPAISVTGVVGRGTPRTPKRPMSSNPNRNDQIQSPVKASPVTSTMSQGKGARPPGGGVDLLAAVSPSVRSVVEKVRAEEKRLQGEQEPESSDTAVSAVPRRPKAAFPNPRKLKGDVVVNSPKGSLDILITALNSRLLEECAEEADLGPPSDPELPARTAQLFRQSNVVKNVKNKVSKEQQRQQLREHVELSDGFDALNEAIAKTSKRLGSSANGIDSLRERFFMIAKHVDGFFADNDVAIAAEKALHAYQGLEDEDENENSDDDVRSGGPSDAGTPPSKKRLSFKMPRADHHRHRGLAKDKAERWNDESLGTIISTGSDAFRLFADPQDATHSQIASTVAILGSLYLKSPPHGESYRNMAATLLRQTYRMPHDEHMPHLVQCLFYPVSAHSNRTRQVHALTTYLSTLPLWRDVGMVGVTQGLRATEERTKLLAQTEHEQSAFESVVAHWKRYSTARVFFAWRDTAYKIKQERSNANSRYTMESQMEALQKALDDRTTQVKSLIERSADVAAATQKEKGSWAKEVETNRVALSQMRIRQKELQDAIDRQENEKMEMRAKIVFLESELDRRLTERTSSFSDFGAISSPQFASSGGSMPFGKSVTFAPRGSLAPTGIVVKDVSAAYSAETELMCEAISELLDQVCDMIAPTREVDGSGKEDMWASVLERCLDEPKTSIIEHCIAEKLCSLSYDKNQMARPRVNEVPFPVEADLPDLVEILLAGNVLFSPIPIESSVCIERSEPSRIAALRSKVRDMFSRARSMESIRTRLSFEVAKKLMTMQSLGGSMLSDGIGSPRNQQ